MATQNNNQQFDLNKIYGLDKCNGFGCELSNTAYENPVARPSLEQIASYVGNRQPSMADNQNMMNQDTNMTNQIEQQGNPAQMYQPITQEQAALYPTPAVVAQENQGDIVANTPGMAVPNDNFSLADAITDFSNPYPVTRESIQYLNGFIRTQIGRRVTIDFLIGSNTIQSKSGYLLAVAANYILINELDTNDVTACDFYNIKFIRFYY